MQTVEGVETPMLEKIESINEEAEQIKEACRIRRSATQKSLAALYGIIDIEFSEEKDEGQEKAAAAPVSAN
jgi:hypothetical protein